MKRLLALIVFLVLGGSTAFAADSYVPFAQTGVSEGTTTSEIAGVPGSCLAFRVNSKISSTLLMTMDCSGNLAVNSIQCASTPCGGSGVSLFLLSTPANGPGIAGTGGAALVNTIGNYEGSLPTAPLGMTIGHLAVECTPYNATDAAAGNSPYNPLDANGLGGATIHFGIVNATHSFLSPLNLGTVVIPTSPQAGPYITSVISTVSSSYTVQAGDGIIVAISDTATTTTQWANTCVAYVGV